MPKKTKKYISNFNSIRILFAFISICIIGCLWGIYTKYFSSLNDTGKDTEITCMGSSHDIVYTFVSKDKKFIKDIKYHLTGLGNLCVPSKTSKFQLDDKSRIMFALYSAMDEMNVEDNISFEELVYNKIPLGAYVAAKTYFIKDNYYQIKFLDRYIPTVVHLTCQYEKWRFDCESKDYKSVSFDCPKTEQMAQQKLSTICNVSPVNYIK